MGNLYFFTWVGFLVALILSSDLFYEALESRDSVVEQEAKDAEPEAAKEDSTPDMEEASEVQVVTPGVEEKTTNA